MTERDQPPSVDAPPGTVIPLASGPMPVIYVHHVRARRYLLRVDDAGRARVTVPRSGTLRGAWTFVQKHAAWLERQRERRALAAPPQRSWGEGAEVLFRGEKAALRSEPLGRVLLLRFADQSLTALPEMTDWRPAVESYLWWLARQELPARVAELAPRLGVVCRRVTVRNQRSRFGSCSATGNLSLHWRLIQMPPEVRDYVIFHELAHLREMNHSARFWALVAQVCPDFQEARAWLRAQRDLLHAPGEC